MKRVREPFAQAGSPNSPLPSSSSAGKRGRQQQGDNDDDGPSSQEPPYGPFQALLARHGVVWPSAAAMAKEDSSDRRKSLGFSCHSNPSKLRVGVERALVHDGARRREFVEVSKISNRFFVFMRKFGGVQAHAAVVAVLTLCHAQGRI